MNIISLPNAINAILTTKWSKINDFLVYLVFPSGTKLKQNTSDALLNYSLKSITLPALTQQSLDVYTGGAWMIASGRPDFARVELTFRDFNDFQLYRGFVEIFEKTLGNFKDECYIQLSLSIGDGENAKSKKLSHFNDLLIENVSQISFDNTTEDQIGEFSVTLRGRRSKVSGAAFYENVGTLVKNL